jgi:5-methylcytosine-specific restriction endonuclease McrA
MEKSKRYSPLKSGSKKFTKNRGSAREKGYDSKWDKFRRRFLFHNPDCYACPNKALHVDHLYRLRDNPELAQTSDNFIPLCHSCHSTVTGKFDAGKIQNIEGKIKWFMEQRRIYNLTNRIKVIAYEK